MKRHWVKRCWIETEGDSQKEQSGGKYGKGGGVHGQEVFLLGDWLEMRIMRTIEKVLSVTACCWIVVTANSRAIVLRLSK